MIRKYADWNARAHERVAVRWRERPVLMSALFIGLTVARQYAVDAAKRRDRQRLDKLEADIRNLQAEMTRVRHALNLPEHPTQREQIRDALRRPGVPGHSRLP